MTKYRIKDICCSNKLNVKGLSKDFPIRYLDTSSLTNGIVTEYQNFILRDAPSRAQRILEHDTIAYSMVRPNLCHYGYFERPDNDIVVSTGFITLSLKSEYKAIIDMKYLYLLLTQPQMTQYLHTIAQNAVSSYPSLVPSDIENLVFDFPNYGKQLEIRSIFFNIDRKIALNREINRNLEAMARQLYDYWFVQFDFPDENGKPYKSSGGKMVWNEKLKREIPEGWCVENLEYYIESITDRIPASNKGKSFYTPIEVIPRKKFSFSDYAPIEEATSGLCRYKEHDILLSNRRVYFHKVCIAPSDGITRDTVIILRPQEELLGYAFQLVFSDHFISYATQHSYGSEQPVLSWESAKKYKVVKPLHCIDERYSRIVNPMIDQILAHEREIRDIKKLRDEILPLLMNGQVSVMPSELNCDLSHD